MAKAPTTTSLNDPVLRERGAFVCDFATRKKAVLKSLGKARRRAWQWDAQRDVSAFVGQEEAQRLLESTDEPQWTLGGLE